jgi:hypothetical protein
MKKIPLLPILTVVFLLLLSRLAQAGDAPPSPDVDAAAWAKLVYAAFTSHSWGVLTGLVLIALVYPLRRFGPDVFKSSFGGLVLAFLVSLCATLGAALSVHVAPSLGLVASSLATAATAAGLWEWLKTHIPGVQAAADKSSVTAQLPAVRVV